MKRLLLSFSLLLFFASNIFSQEILLTIDKNKVSKSEFERIYLKNNSEKITDENEITEYLDLFINFKLKVLEAENLGYDTTSSYLDEYNKYLSQLAEPYFTDDKYEEFLIKQAYERSKKEIRISYILITVKNQDTLTAYNNAMEVYKKLEAGENFEDLAVKYSQSRSVAKDKGDAWFTPVFVMPYNLENFAFENKIGDFSKPLYSGNAYFIIKITDIRPAPGKIKASHIYVRLPRNPSEEDSLKAMKLIDSIDTELKDGGDFAKIAEKYSEDKFSAEKGGDLGWFTTGKMIREFEQAAFSIKKIGNYVGPIRTPVGFHFIMLTDVKPIGSFDDESENIKTELEKKPRYKLIKEKVIADLKKEYNFKQESDLNEFYSNVDSTIFKGKWVAKDFAQNNTVLISFSDQKLTFEDFANYLETNQKAGRVTSINQYVDTQFKEFVNSAIKNYELTQLPNKNEKFRYIVNEYHDGLLLFDITNDMVWDKAVKDTVGLRKYFEQNKNNYYQKLNVIIYSYSDEKSMNKTVKLLNKKEKKNLSDSAIVTIINKKSELISIDQNGVFKEGDNENVDLVIDMMKNKKIENNQQIIVLEKTKKIVYLKDNLPYIKGLVTADYQNLLEKDWIESLKNKYNVVVNQQVFDKIKKEAVNK